MNIASTTATQPAVSTVENTPDARAALQAMLLKKSLQSQQASADQILQQLDGKGQNIDIRV